jgi:hypothetical protein
MEEETNKTPLKIHKWAGGLLIPNGADDPRPEPDLKLDYAEWMASIDWCHVQTLGSARGGFSFEVWVLKDSHTWIMCVDMGSTTSNDVLVEGFADYLDIMAMMAPIATASILEGDTLGSIFEMHRLAAAQRKEMEEASAMIAKRVTTALTDATGPCNCDACVENRKNDEAKKAAQAN